MKAKKCKQTDLFNHYKIKSRNVPRIQIYKMHLVQKKNGLCTVSVMLTLIGRVDVNFIINSNKCFIRLQSQYIQVVQIKPIWGQIYLHVPTTIFYFMVKLHLKLRSIFTNIYRHMKHKKYVIHLHIYVNTLLRIKINLKFISQNKIKYAFCRCFFFAYIKT